MIFYISYPLSFNIKSPGKTSFCTENVSKHKTKLLILQLLAIFYFLLWALNFAPFAIIVMFSDMDITCPSLALTEETSDYGSRDNSNNEEQLEVFSGFCTLPNMLVKWRVIQKRFSYSCFSIWILFIIGKGIRHVVFSGPYVFVMNDGSLGKVTCNVHCIEIIVRICRTDRRDA